MILYRVMAYHIPSLGTPRADYEDFKRLGKLNGEEVAAHLALGVLPPGLLLERDGRAYQVWGAYDSRQRLVYEGKVVHG
jgi:hypothetical protein